MSCPEVQMKALIQTTKGLFYIAHTLPGEIEGGSAGKWMVALYCNTTLVVSTILGFGHEGEYRKANEVMLKSECRYRGTRPKIGPMTSSREAILSVF